MSQIRYCRRDAKKKKNCCKGNCDINLHVQAAYKLHSHPPKSVICLASVRRMGLARINLLNYTHSRTSPGPKYMKENPYERGKMDYCSRCREPKYSTSIVA